MTDLFLSFLAAFALAWIVSGLIYSLVKRLSKLIAVITIIPIFVFVFYNGFELSSHQLFLTGAKEFGEITLDSSPLLIPPNANSQNYCEQFHDKNGKPITNVFKDANQSYCGNFYPYIKVLGLSIPFKKNNKRETIYWTSATSVVVKP